MKQIILIPLLAFTLISFAQIPSNYYDSANGLTGYQLKTELKNIITSGHVTHSYDELYNGYITTDSDNYYENDGTVLDIYSENPNGADPYNYTHNNNRCGNYSGEGVCYNREHLMPQSWFNSARPMVSDIHHVVPTDGKVNGMRGHYPLADVATANWTSLNGSKRGTCAAPGYSGTVFEPIDEFKGDIARIYFYMATRYENEIGSWENANSDGSDPVLDGSNNHVFENWYLDVLLQWHNQDPVSQRELDRNQAAYNYQGNANPFIDHPEYVNLIWNPNPDTQAPSIPNNLVATSITYQSVDLQWQASTDNIGVVEYSIYKAGVLEGTSVTNNFNVSGLQAQTSYEFCVKAKDAAGNFSNCSTPITITTLAPPTYVFYEDFNDCSIMKFTAYNEASDKNWECLTSHGEGNTGAAQMNGYQEDVPSKDWLITTNPINFDDYTNEQLSLYTEYTYGTMPIVLVYSSDYDGSSNPSTFTWTAVPNVVFETPTNSSTEHIQQITNADISSITGSVYLAFKYYSNGSPTRWTIDNMIIDGDSAGISEYLAYQVHVYPNPLHNSDLLLVSTPENLSITDVKLYNLSGQELHISSNNIKSEINVAQLKKGFYFLKLFTNKGSLTKQIIIE